ncbi:MAG: sugar phosphate isomerase/epimerase [Armatimonadetes bacterium]|nr:sugar phosphate isomerase/epimerase [Armatimonadota bacterium]NOG39184.1 sugar phosphate isomerase/epimerase [Armatimonadota bacterium]GIK32371.1 MAG: hypothetical protein BroJett009_13630 [Armatimonadota bacterium]
MEREPQDSALSRRSLLASMVSLPVAGLFRPERFGQIPTSPYAPFRMGIHSYSLRGFDLNRAIETTRRLGLRHWEAFSAHVPLSNDPIFRSAVRTDLRIAGIHLAVCGVQAFDGDAAKSRRIFESAKLLGLETLSADPTPEALPALNDLTQEFGINIAIHNHGPGARYDKAADIERAVSRHNVRMGVCIDTGHALRSAEDPVRWVEVFGERVHDIHLKDVKDRTKWTILGQGDLRLGDFFRALAAQKYAGIVALEYEEKPDDPTADIEACLQAVRMTLSRVR